MFWINPSFHRLSQSSVLKIPFENFQDYGYFMRNTNPNKEKPLVVDMVG